MCISIRAQMQHRLFVSPWCIAGVLTSFNTGLVVIILYVKYLMNESDFGHQIGSIFLSILYSVHSSATASSNQTFLVNL